MTFSYRSSGASASALALLLVTSLAVTQCKALSVIEIPTGPFCDGCVVTNVYYYSPDDVLDWSRDLSLDVAEIRAECETLRTSINRLAFGYESYSISSLISKTTTDILWYSEHSVDSTDEQNILDTLRDYQRLLQSSQREASVQLSELTTIQTQLNELDLYASDVVPEYSARFAIACSGGTNDVCCSCPDYTPYFEVITNRLYGISVNVSVMRNQFNWIYSILYGVDNYLSGVANVGLEGALDVILLAKLRQIGGFSEFYDAWDFLMDEDQRWSYPVTSHAVMSNLMASAHLYPNGVQTSLASYGASYLQSPTYQTLERMPILDRLTVLLHELKDTLSGDQNVHVEGFDDAALDALRDVLEGLEINISAESADAYAQANAEANVDVEVERAEEEIGDLDDENQEALDSDVDPVATPGQPRISDLGDALRDLVSAFESDLPDELVIVRPDETPWLLEGMTINLNAWSNVFDFVRYFMRCVWLFLALSIAGRVARVYGLAVSSCGRLAFGVVQGDVAGWSRAWSQFVNTWADLIGSSLGGD